MKYNPTNYKPKTSKEFYETSHNYGQLLQRYKTLTETVGNLNVRAKNGRVYPIRRKSVESNVWALCVGNQNA